MQLELNSSQSNPVVVVPERRIVSVGNFDIGPLAAALDFARIAMAPVVTSANERAVKLLQAVVVSDPDDQNAHYLLFGLYRDAGQTAAAGRELQIFQELKRKDTERDQKRMRLDSIN